MKLSREMEKVGEEDTRKGGQISSQGWCTPLIPELGRQRQVDLCEFKASLIYRVISRTDRGAFLSRKFKKKIVQKSGRWEGGERRGVQYTLYLFFPPFLSIYSVCRVKGPRKGLSDPDLTPPPA